AGVTTYLEAGPDTTLTTLTQQTLTTAEGSGTGTLAFCSTLQPKAPEPHALTAALARLHTAGHLPHPAPHPPHGRPIPLPTYPFQHRTYWLEDGMTVKETTPDPRSPQPERSQEDAAALASARRGLRSRLEGLTESEQNEALVQLIVAEAEAARREQAPDELFEDELGEDSPFFELGFNSLSAVELRNRLVDATGLALDPMLLFDYPTPAYIAEHVLKQLAAADA
uniref:acyl carrier protein n=1 Tax=Streptomyces phytophilus TaxID=722715 RepID=UPI00215DB6A3